MLMSRDHNGTLALTAFITGCGIVRSLKKNMRARRCSQAANETAENLAAVILQLQGTSAAAGAIPRGCTFSSRTKKQASLE